MRNCVLAAVAAVGLISCDTREARFPVAEDFCGEPSRSLSQQEKKVTALSALYAENKLPGYLFTHINKEAGPNRTEQDVRAVIGSYVLTNPLCCQILPPDHLGNQIWNGEAWTADVGYRRAFSWRYIGDFYVFNDPPSQHRPFYELPGAIRAEDVELRRQQLPRGKFTVASPGSVWMMNNCAELKSFNRG